MRFDQTPGPWIVLLRTVVGASWLIAAFQKIADPAYTDTVLRPALERWSLAATGFGGAFAGSVLLPHLDVVSFAIKVAELCVGVALVFGILARLGALAGFAMVAGAWVIGRGFDHVGGYGVGDIVPMATMLFLTLVPAFRTVRLAAPVVQTQAQPPLRAAEQHRSVAGPAKVIEPAAGILAWTGRARIVLGHRFGRTKAPFRLRSVDADSGRERSPLPS